jgi:uncharacterized cupredoxin-like copper-binding protein
LTRKTSLLVLGAAVGALAVAGCGGGGSSSSSAPATNAAPATSAPSTTAGGSASGGGGGETLKISADPSGALAFNKKSLTAKAGKVTIAMGNPASIPHGVAVEGKGVDKDGQIVQKGGTSTVTVTLKPGTYEFYCPVPGHKQAGMEGHLTVQ